MIIDTLCLRVVAIAIPFVASLAAYDAQLQGWGVLNFLILPSWLEIIIAILVLDFAIWLQHLITHKVPFLWKIHRVHHADRDMDVSTAIRFHPFEIALSMGLKILLIYALPFELNDGFYAYQELRRATLRFYQIFLVLLNWHG